VTLGTDLAIDVINFEGVNMSRVMWSVALAMISGCAPPVSVGHSVAAQLVGGPGGMIPALPLRDPDPGEQSQGIALVTDSISPLWSWTVGMNNGVHLVGGMLVGPSGNPADQIGATYQAGIYLPGNPPQQYNLQLVIAAAESADAMSDERDPEDPFIAQLPANVRSQTWLYDIKVQFGPYEWKMCPEVPNDNPLKRHTRWAVPVSDTWDPTGQNHFGEGLEFTFACISSGVIGKCYKWGYAPWLPEASLQSWEGSTSISMANVHQACTRAARADYCGDGVSHTNADTPVVIWDQLAPTQIRYLPDSLTLQSTPPPCAPYPLDPFEDAWGTRGALCTTHWRWSNLGVTNEDGLCPQRRTIIPTLFGKDGTVNFCETQEEAMNQAKNFFMASPVPPYAQQIPVFIGSDSFLPPGTTTCR
jgi:hypothetical protein